MRFLFPSFLLVVVCGVLYYPSFALGQHNGKQPPASAVTQDLEYIRCDVCEHVARGVQREMKTLRETNRKLEEIQVVDMLESICKPSNETGQWMRYLDIAEHKLENVVSLKLERQEEPSKCREECLTIAKSCEKLLEREIELDDFSAWLWSKKALTVSEVQNKLCHKLTKRCKNKDKSSILPASYKRIDHPYVPVSEKELETERLLASLKSMGMGGSMYNRDDMAGMMDGYDDEDMAGMMGMGDMGGFGGMPGDELEL